MRVLRAPNVVVVNNAVKFAYSRCFSTTSSILGSFPKSFKTSMGAHGPLIDGPDYTFLDGRPTPLRSGQRRRAQEQRDIAVKVLQLMKETKFAIERHQKIQLEEKQKKQEIQDAKLKPKGHRLLKLKANELSSDSS
ncbi:large ribosomal subunit protein mL52 [Panulirus ornatus]|uniref:large ribosomal subunit protein mL52 n=1 Tax=Panulirus ornatus TaxID=150431 RepID=UPI003A8AAD50